jgi:hypothetical protein
MCPYPGLTIGHTFPLIKGWRKPAKPVPPKTVARPGSRATRAASAKYEEYQMNMREYTTKTLPGWRVEAGKCRDWLQEQAGQDAIDQRAANLAGCPASWMSSSWRPMRHMGQCTNYLLLVH